jgi:hypothetical protein
MSEPILYSTPRRVIPVEQRTFRDWCGRVSITSAVMLTLCSLVFLGILFDQLKLEATDAPPGPVTIFSLLGSLLCLVISILSGVCAILPIGKYNGRSRALGFGALAICTAWIIPLVLYYCTSVFDS